MTKESTQTAAAIVAHGLGVQVDDSPAGIFDDWHKRDIESYKLELSIMRKLMDEYDDYVRDHRRSRQCWILAFLFVLGLFVISLVSR